MNRRGLGRDRRPLDGLSALVFTYAAAASYAQAFWLPLFVLAGVAVIGVGLGFAVPRERRYS